MFKSSRLVILCLAVPGFLLAQDKKEPNVLPAPKFLWETKGNLQITQIALSPDGKTVAYGRHEMLPMEFKSGVVLCDARDGKELHSLSARYTDKNAQGFGFVPPDMIVALAFSADGKSIAAVSAGFPGGAASLRVWDVATGKPLKQMTVSATYGQSVAFLPDANKVLIGGVAQQGIYLKILDLVKGTGTDLTTDLRTKLGKSINAQSLLTACCLAPDGHTVLLGVGELNKSALHLFDLKTKKVEANVVPLGAMRPFTQVAISADLQTVALVRQTGGGGGFGVGIGNVPPKVGPGGPGPNVTGPPTAAVEIWDRTAKKKRHQIDFPAGENAFFASLPAPIQFTADSRYLVTAGKTKGHVAIYDVMTGKLAAEHDTGLPALTRVALAGNVLMTGTYQASAIFGGGFVPAAPAPGTLKPLPPGIQPPPPGAQPPQGGPVFGGFGMPNIQATLKIWEWSAPSGSTRPAPSQSPEK